MSETQNNETVETVETTKVEFIDEAFRGRRRYRVRVDGKDVGFVRRHGVIPGRWLSFSLKGEPLTTAKSRNIAAKSLY